MHYYQHHIGDFIKDTARLSDAQTIAYLRLLWKYYDTEHPLQDDFKLLAFQIGTDRDTVELLLLSFFTHTDRGWMHSRCDKEIAEYHQFLDKKAAAGRASAERRKNSSSTGVEQVLNRCSTDVQLTTNHKPLTTNQDIKEPTVLVPSPKVERTPAAPISEIVELYNTKLPMLPRCEVINDARKRSISARWRDVVSEQNFTKDQGLSWFAEFFDHVRDSKFLTGKVKDWKADVDFLFTPTKFAKIVEGSYHKD